MTYPNKTDECKFYVGRGSSGQRSFELVSSNKPYQTKKNFDYSVSLWVGACADGLKFRILPKNMDTELYIEARFQIDAF